MNTAYIFMHWIFLELWMLKSKIKKLIWDTYCTPCGKGLMLQSNSTPMLCVLKRLLHIYRITTVNYYIISKNRLGMLNCLLWVKLTHKYFKSFEGYVVGINDFVSVLFLQIFYWLWKKIVRYYRTKTETKHGREMLIENKCRVKPV